MHTYTFTARDTKTAESVSSEIQADNETAAAKILEERGYAPITIKVKEEEGGLLGAWHRRIPAKQKVIFSRQLSTLVSAGLPLVQSLASVKDQTANKTLQEVIGAIITEVEGGTTLAEAMSHHPKVFNNIYISLVAAGETSGTLDKSLERLANQQEKDAEILAKVRGAMIYPAIVIVVLLAVVTFMLTTVLPQVENLYASLPGASLPFVTRFLLSISGFIQHFWWLIFLLIVGGVFVGRRWIQTEPGRAWVDRFKLRAPAIGPLYTKLCMARFARIGGTLVASGVPIIKMLNTTAEAVDNVHVAASINRATEQVKGGKNLSDSLAGDPYFLPLVPNMLRTGEQSGSLETMMGRLADYYEREVENELKTISTIIEPALMIMVGVMALIVVAAVLLPIYGLAGKNLTP